jgi:hypothetical protein
MYILILRNVAGGKQIYDRIYATLADAERAMHHAKELGIFISLYQLELVEGQAL